MCYSLPVSSENSRASTTRCTPQVGGSYPMRNRLSARTALLTATAIAATAILASCGLNEKDVYSKPDATICVYDKEDGKLIKQLPPGADRTKVEDDAIV